MYNYNFPNFCAKLAIFSEKSKEKTLNLIFLCFLFDIIGANSIILLNFAEK